ncbi:MAG: TIGR02147 family protein [Myxococcota bacterium]
MRTGDLPDVFQFLSYRQFLDAWYAARKAADARFSHRLFARRAGAASPSLLAEVASGKRNLSAPMIDGFVRALGLGGGAAAFFRDLVAFDQGPTETERNAAWDRIAASRRFRQARPIDGAAFAYLSSWFLPAIRELALRSDFRAEAEWVAKTLEPRIPVAQARDALGVLRQLGLLVERDGRWVPADTSVATPHQVRGLAVHNYHRQMLERATAAVGSVPSAERHLVGVTVAVPESLVPALKAELDRFQERLLHLCDQHAADAERVYQVELCLFPLSRGRGEPT